MPITPSSVSFISLDMVDYLAPGLRNPLYVIVTRIILGRVHASASAAVMNIANVAQNVLTIRYWSCVTFTSMHAYINANVNHPRLLSSPLASSLHAYMVKLIAHIR